MSARTASAQNVKVTLGTATPGGGFPVYGDAFIAALKAQDPTLEIVPVNTKGSTENVPRLEAGTLDLALVQGEVVHEALDGIGRPKANLRILTAMYPTAGMFVVRADSPAKTIADLKGRKIAWGAAGSGLVILGRYVMDGLGLDAAKDFEPVYLERAGDGPAMVLDGQGRRIVGRRLGLAGLRRGVVEQGGRSLHCAQRRRTRAHPGQARISQDDHPGRRQFSQSERADRVGRLVEFRDGAARSRRGGRASPCQGAACRRSDAVAATWRTRPRKTRLAALTDPNLLHPGVLAYYRQAGLTPKSP